MPKNLMNNHDDLVDSSENRLIADESSNAKPSPVNDTEEYCSPAFAAGQLVLATFLGTLTAFLWGLAYNAEDRRLKKYGLLAGAVFGWLLAFAAVFLPSTPFDRLWSVGFTLVALVATLLMRFSPRRPKPGWLKLLGLVFVSLVWVFAGLVLALAIQRG
jgi:hypothetical protein